MSLCCVRICIYTYGSARVCICLCVYIYNIHTYTQTHPHTRCNDSLLLANSQHHRGLNSACAKAQITFPSMVASQMNSVTCTGDDSYSFTFFFLHTNNMRDLTRWWYLCSDKDTKVNILLHAYVCLNTSPCILMHVYCVALYTHTLSILLYIHIHLVYCVPLYTLVHCVPLCTHVYCVALYTSQLCIHIHLYWYCVPLYTHTL